MSRGPQSRAEPPHAISGLTHRASLDFEAAQMRQGLAGRHAEHVLADRAAEQPAEAVDHTARFGEEYFQLVEPLAVLAIERIEPRMQSVERVAMSRQDQQVGRQLLEPGNRIKPFAKRIAVGLGHAERDVGADAREHLIAGEEQAVALVEQAGMFRAVARSADDAPVDAADRHGVALLDTAIAHRHRRHDAAEAGPAPPGGLGELFFAPAGADADRGYLVG